MIRFFEKKDSKAIISLWNEAFGDKEEIILQFLKHFGRYMLIFETDKKAVSMLTMIPTSIGGEMGRYIYAVATDKEYRNQGYAGTLIEFAKQLLKENNEEFMVILPQNDGLFGFYEKFGFSELKCVKHFEIETNLSEKCIETVEIIDAKEYFDFRKSYFMDRNFVEWDVKMLEFFEEIYRGKFVKVSKNEKTIAKAFCYVYKDMLVVSELLSEENIALNALGYFFGKEKVAGVAEFRDGERYAMVYPRKFSGCYFGLGMN